MRIAIAVEGTRGDIHPMLVLAASLVRRGHDVVFCAPPDFAESVASRGLPFRPVGRDIRAYLTQEAHALHRGPLAMVRAADRLFRENLGAQFRDLLAGVERADLVIAAGTQVAAASLAEQLGAAYRFVAFDPILLPSSHHPPFAFPWAELSPRVNRLAWRLQDGLTRLRIGPVLGRERARLGLPPVRDPYALCLGPRPILAAEEILAPAPADVKEVQTIGCLHPFEPAPLPEKLEQFLRAGEPPIYVGFGSMTDPDPARTTRLVLEGARRAGVRVLLSEGWAGLGEVPLPETALAIGSVPHAGLFPRVAAVVHHGGAGTTTTAARAGVPQVLIPHVLDQYHWAHRVQRLGLAPPPIVRRRLDADRLAATLRAVRDNEVLTERAQEIAERLRAALRARPEPADAIA
jgi:UDP:flavonoid glycosyltransferase YjiC (YdhE family)